MAGPARAIIRAGCYIWNGCMEASSGLLTKTPMTFNSSAWSYVQNLYDDVMAPIGIALVGVFFVIGYINSTTDFRQALTLENSVWRFLKYVIALAIIDIFIAYIPNMFKWAKWIVQRIINVGSEYDALYLDVDDIWPNSGNVLGVIPGCVLGFAFFIVCGICGLIILITIYKRFINLYLLVVCAPIALSTFSGGERAANTGFTYIKTFLGICFEVVLIQVVLVIGTKLIGSIDTGIFGSDLDEDDRVKALLASIIQVSVVGTAVKGTDGFIRKTFGLG